MLAVVDSGSVVVRGWGTEAGSRVYILVDAILPSFVVCVGVVKRGLRRAIKARGVWVEVASKGL